MEEKNYMKRTFLRIAQYLKECGGQNKLQIKSEYKMS